MVPKLATEKEVGGWLEGRRKDVPRYVLSTHCWSKRQIFWGHPLEVIIYQMHFSMWKWRVWMRWGSETESNSLKAVEVDDRSSWFENRPFFHCATMLFMKTLKYNLCTKLDWYLVWGKQKMFLAAKVGDFLSSSTED